MTVLLWIPFALALWFLLSIPVAVAVGKFMRAGSRD